MKGNKSILDLFSDASIDCEKWIFQRPQSDKFKIYDAQELLIYFFSYMILIFQSFDFKFSSFDQNISALHKMFVS